jgi:CHAT domain-containing protein
MKLPRLAAALLLLLAAGGALQSDEPSLAELQQSAADLEAASKLADALPLREKIVAMVRREQGADSPAAAQALSELANNLRRQNKLALAEAPAREALEIRVRKLGQKDLATISSYGQLVDILNHARKFDEAEAPAREMVALREEAFGKEHLETAGGCVMLAGTLHFLKKNDEAAELFQRANDIFREQLGPDHASTKETDRNIGDNLNAIIVETALAKERELRDPLAARYAAFEHVLEVMRQTMPPSRHPNGHRRMAQAMTHLGDLSQAQGRRADARRWYEQALAMQAKLFEKDSPEGHPEWAQSHMRLAKTLHAHGEYEEAGRHAREALAMCRRIYPAEKFPNGHPDLATAMTELAFMTGGGETGRQLYEEALAMQKKLYPRGDQRTVTTLMNLGNVLIGLKRPAEAAARLTEALEMSRKLDPGATFEQATTRQYLARLYEQLGQRKEAEAHLQGALDQFHEIYSRERYPQGHDHLALVERELAQTLHEHGNTKAAAEHCDIAERMMFDLAAAHLPDVSEAEALNFAVLHLSTPDLLISTWPALGKSAGELYEHLWRRRGLIHRVHGLRQRVAVQSAAPEVKQLYQRYQAARQQIAQSALAPAAASAGERAAAASKLASLSKTKEELERELAAALPELRRITEIARPPSHSKLLEKLPRTAALIDFVHFADWPSGEKLPTLSYSAFVLADGRVARVNLGPAERIDPLVKRWRKEIVADEARERATAGELGKILWNPIAAALPRGVKTVFIVPDGSLSSVPWAALPGEGKNSILLESRALATLPHAQFLLDKIDSAPPKDERSLLAVGPVTFGKQSALWPDLPGTQQELDDVAAIAGKGATVVRGSDAGLQRILAELPKANYAHVATHGFFADAKMQSILQVDPANFAQRGGPVPIRSSAAARNPLVLSGLVFAPAGEQDQGILTAEQIAALPLTNLRLAVLSACETGLGDVAGGEGVFGLQRAFHQAGARNVVASLWKVNDQATAAQMRLFYRYLWEENLSPLEALRQAQLALYRHPEQVAALATAERGPNFDKVVKLVDGGTTAGPRCSPRLWAAFVLSGDGN